MIDVMEEYYDMLFIRKSKILKDKILAFLPQDKHTLHEIISLKRIKLI